MPSFVPRTRVLAKQRSVKKVPFVELYNGRLQGVVSSGSDIMRVYVSTIEAGTGNFSCSTNNNRPCGGANYGSCNHISELFENAIEQFGAEQVMRYLKMEQFQDERSISYIINQLNGSSQRLNTGEVFSRFLEHLRFLELASSEEEVPELAWFVTGA